MRGVKQKLNRKKNLVPSVLGKNPCAERKGHGQNTPSEELRAHFSLQCLICMETAPLIALITYPTEEGAGPAPHQPWRHRAGTQQLSFYVKLQGRTSNRYFPPLVEADIKVQALSTWFGF